MDDKEKRFVDDLIAAGLRNYAGEEPRVGLEGRVLAGVRARQQAARRRMAWWWAAGLAGAAALVALLAVTLTHRQPAPLPAIAKTPTSPPAPLVAKAVSQAPKPVARRPVRPAAATPVDWRPQQFPTPRPLSEQEKLLVAYVRALNASPEASAPNAKQDAEHDLSIPPLSIAAIKIDPLSPEEDGDGQ